MVTPHHHKYILSAKQVQLKNQSVPTLIAQETITVGVRRSSSTAPPPRLLFTMSLKNNRRHYRTSTPKRRPDAALTQAVKLFGSPITLTRTVKLSGSTRNRGDNSRPPPTTHTGGDRPCTCRHPPLVPALAVVPLSIPPLPTRMHDSKWVPL
jgi:hypothetical protein